MINEEVEVEIVTIYNITTGFCFFLARNVHLNLKKISFTERVSNWIFTPDQNYSPVTQITCVGLDSDGQRYETQTLIEYKQLPNKVSCLNYGACSRHGN